MVEPEYVGGMASADLGGAVTSSRANIGRYWVRSSGPTSIQSDG